MDKIKSLEEEIKKIKERNSKVEADKAWETSWTRKILLSIFTYLAVSLYMYAISLPNPWLNAIIPSVAFLLSTLTLPSLKKLWGKYIYKK